jgi:hypothetical protein
VSAEPGCAPAVTGTAGPCPDHRGDLIPPGKRLAILDCGLPGYQLAALIVDGKTVRLVAPRKTIAFGMCIIGLAQTSRALAGLTDGAIPLGRIA